MGSTQGRCDLDGSVECIEDSELPRGESIAERLPLDVLHRNVVLALSRLAERMDGADVRVI
jgi:hypothetical protein